VSSVFKWSGVPAGMAAIFATLLVITLALFCPTAQAASDGFLDPEKAFILQAKVEGTDHNILKLSFKIAPGYYMYRERFEFVAESTAFKLGAPQFPAGQTKYDPTFNKEMELYFKDIQIRVPLVQLPAQQTQAPATEATASRTLQVKITAQGCATAGLCYPPMDFYIKLNARTDAPGYTLLAAPPASLFERLAQGQLSEILFSDNDLTLADLLNSTGLVEVVLLFFVLGLLLALTPCVLPMVPILSVLLVGEQHQVSRARGTLLAFSYVAGMSVVYTALGVAAGLSGAGLAAWLQTPWVLALFALLLATLALSMFDVFTFQMPAALQTKLTAKNNSILGGRLGAAALMGALSALVVGPCVAAPLAGALLYISQTGDVFLGGLALFAMAWGMGVPLLLMGASAGKLMPKTGPWMEGVKQFFGVLLFATAWWMLVPVLPTWLQIGGWAVLTLFSAVLLRTFDSQGTEPGLVGRLRKTLGVLLTMLCLIWLLGIASGGRSLLQPLAHLARANTTETLSRDATQEALARTSVPSSARSALVGDTERTVRADSAVTNNHINQPVFKRVRTVAELEAALAQSARPVMLDFYADWCVSCKEMESFTFTDPNVAARMGQLLLLQADVTANDPDDRALLKRYKLFGPPGIIFFDVGGQERKDVRVVGFQDAKRFASNLDRLLSLK